VVLVFGLLPGRTNVRDTGVVMGLKEVERKRRGTGVRSWIGVGEFRWETSSRSPCAGSWGCEDRGQGVGASALLYEGGPSVSTVRDPYSQAVGL